MLGRHLFRSRPVQAGKGPAATGKGFGPTPPAQPAKQPKKGSRKKQQQQAQQARQESSSASSSNGAGGTSLPLAKEAAAEQEGAGKEDFENRLAALKAKAKVSPRPRPGPLDLGSDPLSGPLDPPPSSAKPEEGQEGGLSWQKLAAGGAGLALALVFIVTSVTGGGGGPVTPPPTSQGAPQLSAEARRQLEGRLRELEASLAADPADVAALKQAGSARNVLGDFPGAVSALSAATRAAPKDEAAWRLLAEAQMGQGDNKGAVAAYREVLGLVREPALYEVQGLAAALVRSGDPAGAAQELRALLERPLPAPPAPPRAPPGPEQQPSRSGASGEASPGPAGEAGKEAAPGSAAPSSAQQEEAAAAAAAEPDTPLDSYSARMLLAKVLTQWRGHDPDALAVYDELIAAAPERYEALLAKGLVLRGQGRKGEAQRAFLRARYLAPPDQRPLVDTLTAPSAGS